MGERWDNFVQEMMYPVVKFQQWYDRDEDNRFVFWFTTIATSVMTCIVFAGLALGVRAIARAVSDDSTITVLQGNPCLTDKGLIKEWAPASCYDSGHKHVVAATETPATDEQRITAMTRNNDATVTPVNDAAYAPPCKKDGLPGCSDSIYGKRLLYGTVATTTLHNDEKIVEEGHLQPDYTEVEVDPCGTDQCENVKEKFCGDVLDKFVPGNTLHVVLNESKQADYNGCYTVEVVRLTFGGDYVRMRRK